MEVEETAVLESESITTEESAVEQTEPEAKEAEPTVEELRAALATEKAARERAENNAKSAHGQLKVRQDVTAELQALRRTQTNIDAKVNALAKGQITGDLAATERELAAVQQVNQEQEAQTRFNEQAQGILSLLQREANTLALPLDTAPEFAEVRNLWNEGLRIKNVAMMLDAANAAGEIRENTQIAAWEKEQAEERKKSGSLNTPNIRAAGNRNSAVAGAQLEKDVAAGRVAMTPEIQKRLEKYWSEEGIGGS